MINSILEDLYSSEDKLDIGFFVEAGALDGEYLSNTMWLEQNRGWTGILVEPDTANFKKVKQKQRKTWISKTCLGLEKYPYEAVIKRKDKLIPNMVSSGNSALMVSHIGYIS